MNPPIRREKRSDILQRARPLLLLLLLLALDVRLFSLGSKSLWLDEANSIRVAKLGQADFWAGNAEAYHPPLFYALLEYWLQFGENEANLRLPMAIGGVACVLLVYAFASELAGSQVALTAAGLTAFSPLLIWYSQELRPYSLLAALALIGMIALRRMLLRPHLGWWLVFAAASIVMLYLHYAAVLLFVVEAVFVIASLAAGRATRLGIVGWLAGLLVTLVALWPWFSTPVFGNFVGYYLSNGGYVGDLLASRFNLKLELNQISGELVILALAFVLVLMFALFPLFRALYRGGVLARLRAAAPVQVVSAVLFLASLVAFVVPQAYSLKREIAILWPFALVLFAWLWPWRPQSYGFVGCILALSLAASVVNLALVPKDQWREAAAYISANSAANDVVFLEPAYMKTPFDYYNRQGLEAVGADFNAGDDRLSKLACQYDRVWLVDHQIDRDPLARTQHWFDARSQPALTISFFRIDVRLYAMDHARDHCPPVS